MTIREGTPDDIPAIVELLRQSLGEDLMPKTDAFWKWKHVQNPFGASDVLLAWEDDQLVGVRAFMRWEWATRDRIFHAVRAVDTATRPTHQGKGIFRTLTLALVEKCRTDGIDFIFNTPNRSSRPGYLKMGWKKVGRLPLHVRPVLHATRKRADFEEVYRWNDEWLSRYTYSPTEGIATSRTAGYFRWRYGSNPNISYHMVGGDGYVVVFRLKVHRWGTEFRICDAYPETVHGRQSELSEAVRQSGARVVTWSGPGVGQSSILLPAGPLLTLYPFTGEARRLTFRSWKPSLGDLEVF